MNLVLVEEQDFVGDDVVRLNGRRFEHVRDIHRAGVGGSLRVGRLGGRLGTAVIEEMSEEHLIARVQLDEEPPPPLPVLLFLALPRPKFLAKALQTVAGLGVKDLYLFNAYKVEKVYWSCAQLIESEIRKACLLGLEQARDTLLPRVYLRRLFKPFVEDELPGLVGTTRALVAHPGANQPFPSEPPKPASLAIGPEGGFIDYEVNKLIDAGFEAVGFGPRILKVETAVAALLGRWL